MKELHDLLINALCGRYNVPQDFDTLTRFKLSITCTTNAMWIVDLEIDGDSVKSAKSVDLTTALSIVANSWLCRIHVQVDDPVLRLKLYLQGEK